VHILTLGLNHKTAPVEVRERLAFPPSTLETALQELARCDGLHEAAILSTCNRAEIYTVATHAGHGLETAQRFLGDFHHLRDEDFAPHLYRFLDADAARHLFRVACGADSLVVGESQILGQVRDALLAAQQSGTARLVLNELFQRALHVGKRARTETDIGRGALSVSSAAVELALQIFGALEGHRVLVLGAGEMSELTAQYLVDSGVRSVWVANRTHARAVQLAERFGGEAVPFDDFPQKMVETDIVISSTSAPHFIIEPTQLAGIMRQRRGRPLFLIDIAVPRDVDPAVRKMNNVFAYDMDDLEEVVASHRAERERELMKIEQLIEEEVRSLQRWLHALDAKPLICALQRQMEELRQAELEKWLRKLPHLSDQERQTIEALMRGFANKILHAPLVQIRQFATEPDGYLRLEAVRRVFNLDLDHQEGEELSP